MEMQQGHNKEISSGSLVGDNYAVLCFEDAMFQMERTKQLYLNQMIEYMVFDLETSPSYNPWEGEIIMFSWAHEADEIGYAVPMYVANEIHHDANTLPYIIPQVNFNITPEQKAQLIEKVKELLLLIPIVGHNLKYDVKWGAWHRWLEIAKVKIKADTLIMAFQLFNKGAKGELTLKGLTNKYCGVNDHWEYNVHDYLNRFKRVKDRNFGMLPTGLLGPYAAKDGIYNRKLYQELQRMMPEWMQSINDTVTYATKAFADAEIKGLCIDQNMRGFLSQQYHERQRECIQNIFSLHIVKKYVEDKMIGLRNVNNAKKRVSSRKTEEELLEEAFNVSSNKHLGELIYGKAYYAIPVMKDFLTDKGAPQVNKDFIEHYLKKLKSFNFAEIESARASAMQIAIPSVREEELKMIDEEFAKPLQFKTFLENLAVYKRLEKLRTTYIDNLDADSFEGLYKPEFNLAFVITGRLSSGFHTLPGGCDIKRLYNSRWANEGGLFVAVDQSQLELRVVASLSKETKMIDAFKNGMDAHKATGAAIYKVPFDQVTDKMRKVGKVTNFALLFGKSAKNLAEELGISEQEAIKILEGFFSGYPNLAAWIKEQQAYVRKEKHTRTPWGRRIPVNEAYSQDKWELLKADRVAVNYPVQSTASDIVVTSVCNIWKRFTYNERLRSLLVGSVHDSIEIDTFPGELFRVLKILQEEAVDNIAKTQSWMTCPLELSFELGKSWGGALECSIKELTDDRVVFEAEDIRKDFLHLKQIAEKCYNVDLQILKEEPIEEKDFGEDIFVRDTTQWTCRVAISKR